MLQNTDAYRRLLGIVRGRNVLELGVGTGMLTKLLLDAGAARVLGYEIDPALAARAAALIGHGDRLGRLEIVRGDYTDPEELRTGRLREAVFATSPWCLVANPAYSTLDYIQKEILPGFDDAVLMVPERLASSSVMAEHGFQEAFVLDGADFDPPATGKHVVLRSGFAERHFRDLHAEMGRLRPGAIESERLAELDEVFSAELRKVAPWA
jgi:SAM-dependent methyltransferase